MLCKNGHLYDVNSTGIDSKGHRYCKTCKRIKGRVRIQFQGFEYNTGLCRYGHQIDDNPYLRNGKTRCGICAVNTSRRRRERKLSLDATYSIQDEILTRKIFGNKCFKCDSTDSLQIDHHRPLSKGFSLCRENAVLLCIRCNASKSDRMPEDFYTHNELECLNSLLVVATF